MLHACLPARCLLQETVDTSDIEQTVWPRLAAIGEQLWSPLGTTNASTPSIGSAYARLSAFR